MSIENWRQSVLSRVVRLTAKLLIGTFLLLTYAAVLALGVCSIAGFFGNHRYFELASHFRLVYFYGLLACCLVLVLMRRWKGLAVSSAFLLLNVIPIAVLYFEGGPQAVAQGANPAASGARELKVLQINVWAYKNKHYSDAIEVIRKHDPDVIGIVEVTRDWKKVLQKELKDYPHVAIEERFGGLALFSRYPLEGAEVLSSGKMERPRIRTTLKLPDTKVTLILAHVARPRRNYSLRNRDFESVTAEAASAARPMILFGDLNCSPWSPTFRKLLVDGKLRDTENGFGLQPTWSPRGFIPFVPIDHFLTSLDVKTVEREVGPDVGSDHLPVFVKLMVPVTKASKASVPAKPVATVTRKSKISATRVPN